MDCGFAGCGFEAVRWDAIMPPGTGVTLRARTREEGGGWSDWSASFETSPADTSDVPDGRYAELQFTLTTSEDEVTPVITGFSVDWQRP
jgi:hypothetical protein